MPALRGRALVVVGARGDQGRGLSSLAQPLQGQQTRGRHDGHDHPPRGLAHVAAHPGPEHAQAQGAQAVAGSQADLPADRQIAVAGGPDDPQTGQRRGGHDAKGDHAVGGRGQECHRRLAEDQDAHGRGDQDGDAQGAIAGEPGNGRPACGVL